MAFVRTSNVRSGPAGDNRDANGGRRAPGSHSLPGNSGVPGRHSAPRDHRAPGSSRAARGLIAAAALALGLFFAFPQSGCATGIHEPDRASTQSQRADAAALRVVTLRGPTGAGMARLIDAAPMVADGVTATYEVAGSPDVAVARVLSGQADLASVPLNVAAKLYNSGVPYRMAAVNVLGVLYVVSTGPAVSTLDDLRGRTVFSVGKGATPEYVLRYLLSAAGLEPDRDLTLDFRYEQVELASLLVSGNVDLAVLPEPFVSQVLARRPDARIVLDLNRVWARTVAENVPLAQGCLIVREQVWREHPAAVRAFLDAYRNTVQWENANPDAAAIEIGNADLGIAPGIAKAAIPRLSLVFEPAASAKPSVESFLSVLLKYAPESIGGHLPDSGFYLDY